MNKSTNTCITGNSILFKWLNYFQTNLKLVFFFSTKSQDRNYYPNSSTPLKISNSGSITENKTYEIANFQLIKNHNDT